MAEIKIRKWKKKQCRHCVPLDQEPLVVSGRGYTEYEIRFCKICGRIIGIITKDYDDLYSEEIWLRN